MILSYDFFGKKNVQIGPIGYIKFVLEKYYRFFPKMVAAVILFQILIMVGDGPNFNSLKTINTCPTSYWENLLFINNFTKYGEIVIKEFTTSR